MKRYYAHDPNVADPVTVGTDNRDEALKYVELGWAVVDASTLTAQLTHEQMEQLHAQVTTLSEQRIVAARDRDWKQVLELTEQMRPLIEQYYDLSNVLYEQTYNALNNK